MTKSTKTDTKKKAVGRLEKVDGVVTMLPPEDEEETKEEDSQDQVVEEKKGTVLVQSSKEPDDVQYVFDEESEEKSRLQVEKVRKENQERAAKEANKLSPKKMGNTVVTSSTTYDDIDLGILNADIQTVQTKEKK